MFFHVLKMGVPDVRSSGDQGGVCADQEAFTLRIAQPRRSGSPNCDAERLSGAQGRWRTGREDPLDRIATCHGVRRRRALHARLSGIPELCVTEWSKPASLPRPYRDPIELLLSGNSLMSSPATTANLLDAREHMEAVVVQQSSDLKTEVHSENTVLVIDEDIGFFIAVTSRLMDRALNVRLKKYGVSFGQWPFLMMLWAEDGLTQRDLSRRLSNEEATTTRTLDRMEADGLIRRKANIADRRQRNIYLTSKGRSLRDKLVPEALANSDVTTGQLTPKEVTALRAALKKMVGSLKELSR